MSTREVQVISLVAEGKTDKEVAQSLGISEETVGWYLKRAYRECQVHSRAQLTRWFLTQCGG